MLALERSRSPEAERLILLHYTAARTEQDRFYSVAVLMSIGTEKSLPVLQDALKSKRKDIRFAAFEALALVSERTRGTA